MRRLFAALAILGVLVACHPLTIVPGSEDIPDTCENPQDNNDTPVRAGFPGDHETGPEAGGIDESQLPPSNEPSVWHITQPGRVVDSVFHHGRIEVEAPNVTIRNSIICGTGSHIVRNESTGLTVENSILRGEQGTTFGGAFGGEPCASALAFGDYTATAVEFTHCADGAKVSASVEIHDSWFHDNFQGCIPGPECTHNDTVQMGGTTLSHFVFEGNAAYQLPCPHGNVHIWLSPTQDPPFGGDLSVTGNFFYGIKALGVDDGLTFTAGLFANNTLAGSASAGPFSSPLYQGDGLSSVTISDNVYESGEDADGQLDPSYVCTP